VSYNPITGTTLCDDCRKSRYGSNETFIETYWASGNKHYCCECWPRHREYYERGCWKRIGNYYAAPFE
jgi:hypothetical protein